MTMTLTYHWLACLLLPIIVSAQTTITNGPEPHIWTGHSGVVRGSVWDGQYLWTASMDTQVIRWNITSGGGEIVWFPSRDEDPVSFHSITHFGECPGMLATCSIM